MNKIAIAVFSMFVSWCSSGYWLATHRVTIMRVALAACFFTFMYCETKRLYQRGAFRRENLVEAVQFMILSSSFISGVFVTAPRIMELLGIVFLQIPFMVIIGLFQLVMVSWLVDRYVCRCASQAEAPPM